MENLDGVEMEVELTVGGETRTLNMEMKGQDDLCECPKDTIIVVPTLDGNQWAGKFKDWDDENLIIEPLSGGRSIALEESWFNKYLQEIKP